jgi:hypothetical protein
MLSGAAVANAQTPPESPAPVQRTASPPAPAAPKPAIVPLKVQVTITRLQKEVVTARNPFVLWVNANDDRRSTRVSLASSVPMSDGAKINYQSVGTQINCNADSTPDGRFRLDLTVNDSSVVPGKDGALPSIQSLTSNNILLVREAQTAEFLSTTDKVTGEVTKIDVVVTALR